MPPNEKTSKNNSSGDGWWSRRLANKLSSLSDASSKETHQTLARWVGFNRRRAASGALTTRGFLDALVRATAEPPPPGASQQRRRQLPVAAVLSVVHQTVLLDRNNGRKWDRLSDLRLRLGEQVVVPYVEHLYARSSSPSRKPEDAGTVLAVLDRVLAFVKEWDEANAFGEPTLIGQIRRKAQAAKAALTTAAAAIDATAAAPPSSTEKGRVRTAPAKAGEEEETQDARTGEASTGDGVEDNEGAVSTEKPPSATSAPGKAPAVKGGDGSEDAVPVRDNTSMVEDSRGGAAVPPEAGGKRKEPTGKSAAAAAAAAATAPSVAGGVGATTAASKSEVAYDFDSKGIPGRPNQLDPRMFLGPCQDIATVQISRDLSNDGAVQLSSLLSSLPEDVRNVCGMDGADGGGNGGTGEGDGATPGAKKEPIELPIDQARDFSIRVDEVLIDMDLDEQLRNIELYRNLVVQQKSARERLLQMLVQSRCKFGAEEAAEAYYGAERIQRQVLERKQILADAMELEGLDIVEDSPTTEGGGGDDGTGFGDSSKRKKKDRAFAPLTWYKGDSAQLGTSGDGSSPLPDAKRQRTE